MQIKPKKSLGQNFLHEKNIINKIINAYNISNDDEVLEIGPGTGNLTNFFVNQNPKKIYVIEKDFNLSEELSKKFMDKISIINMDILKISDEFYSGKKFLILGKVQ